MKRILSAIGISLLSIVVALAVGEIVLRIFYKYPQPQFMKIDKVLGQRLRPTLKGWYTQEGTSHVSINHAGFRDREFETGKNGATRIAVLGDSYTEALQVDKEDSFPGLLEKNSAGTLEVLNFGVSGYGTAQELLTYTAFARKYHPDIVVLAFYPGNDVSDNSRTLSRGFQRPYYVVNKGNLRLDNGFLHSSKFRRNPGIYDTYYFLTDNFLIFSFLDQLRYKAGFREAAIKQAERQQEEAEQLIYKPDTPDQLAAWDVTEKLIDRLAAEVKKDGAKFVLFVQDSLPWQIKQDAQSRYYVENRLSRLCQARSYICGFMGPVAIAYQEQTGRNLHGLNGAKSGHWNKEGHKVAYQVLKALLQKEKLIPLILPGKTTVTDAGNAGK